MNIPAHQHDDVPAIVATITALGLNLADINMLIQIGASVGAFVLVWLKVYEKWKKNKEKK